MSAAPSTDATRPELALVGRIGRAHGLRGELVVQPETDRPERFVKLRSVYVGPTEARATTVQIESARVATAGVLVKLAGIGSRTEAETLRGQQMFIPATDLLPLPDDRIYIHDLIGLRVEDEAGTLLGEVTDVMLLPANDVYVVRSPSRGEVLVPAVESIVRSVDPVAGRVVVRPLPGLFDDDVA